MSTIKVVFCGDTAVGKTAIIHYFTEKEPGENLQPTIAATYKKLVMNDINGNVTLEIWDTAGEEKYYSTITGCFKDAQVIVIVYDITELQTFANIESHWIQQVLDNSPVDVKIILVGNKLDLKDRRAVSIDQATKYASSAKLRSFFETSAINGENIGNLFKEIASVELNQARNTTKLVPNKEKNWKKCCK